MTLNWLTDDRRDIVEPDHKLIDLIGARLVGGIRALSDGPNYAKLPAFGVSPLNL